MKISPQWLRDFIDLTVEDSRLAEALTLAGIAVEAWSGEGADTIFEMDITTNRPDAMNHFGVARECSAIYDLPLRPIQPVLPPPQGKPDFDLVIEDAVGCPRYTARVLRGVRMQSSPAWIEERLTRVGQRAVNSAADASNYTLWEMGHPTHAFDLDLLAGGKICIRRARAGETLKTLDGVRRQLSPEDLVIADANQPVALAGVMGGFDTMITDRTRNILVESAWFDPLAIRQSSKRHGLHTDASHRFERGADYGATQLACARVAERILGSSGGQLAGEELDRVARTLDQAPVALRISEVRRILGRQLPTHEVVRILTLLGFELVPEPGEEPEFVVRIPSWRMDIEREIDLIEELARLHGYDQFANTLPVGAGAVVDPPEAAKQQKLRSSLLALGFDEGLSTTFISHADAEQFSAVPVVELENPLSEEASVLRSSMLPGVLKMLDYNLNRGNSRVRLFEMGSVFEASGLDVLEKPRAGLGATGSVDAPGFAPGRPLSFFDLKGDLENLLHPFAHQTLTFEAPELDYLHPGLSARARMDGIAVAEFGQLHPALGAAHKLRQDVFVAEIFLDVLYRRGLRELRYQALPRYPAVERDLSFVFSDAVRFAAIEQAVSGLGLNELHSFTPVEVFRGSGIPNGAYSLLLRAKFQSRERTLREEEVSRWISALIEALEKLGGAQRA